jgi:hypothetical protein
MSAVTVEIDPMWVKFVRSPAFRIVAALQGVAVSFAPLFLYWCGQGKPFHDDEWFVMPLCFAVIFFVPLVYFRLGNAVAEELRKKRDPELAGFANQS